MKIQQEYLTAIKSFGYTEREARFLYMVADTFRLFHTDTFAAVQRQQVRPHCPRIHQESSRTGAR